MSSRRADALTQAGDILSHTQTSPRTGPSTGWLDADGIDAESILAPLDLEPGRYRVMAHRIAERWMQNTHGCTGRHCSSPAHAADRQVMYELVWAILLPEYIPPGIPEDPLKGDFTNAYGNRVVKGSKKKKPATRPDNDSY